MPAAEFVDLYEVLQVSPNAEKDTIKRVHQILSLKYQLATEENKATAYFSQLQQAAATLLDNETRAAYDRERLARLALSLPPTAAIQSDAAPALAVAPAEVLAPPVPATAPEAPVAPPPAANPVGPVTPTPVEPPEKQLLNPNRFMQGLNVAEEKRRRAGLVEICYRQRILKPRQPALSVKQLEDGMELTVDQLEASLWYLKETDLVRVSDAGNYSISVRGMNAIEGGFINFVEGIFDMKSFNG